MEGVQPEGVDGEYDQVGDVGGGELGVARTGSGCTPSEVLYTEQETIAPPMGDRKSTRLNSSHQIISYAVFCLKKKKLKKI